MLKEACATILCRHSVCEVIDLSRAETNRRRINDSNLSLAEHMIVTRGNGSGPIVYRVQMDLIRKIRRVVTVGVTMEMLPGGNPGFISTPIVKTRNAMILRLFLRRTRRRRLSRLPRIITIAMPTAASHMLNNTLKLKPCSTQPNAENS